MADRTEVLPIEGMSCAHCVRAVSDALTEVEGVEVQEIRMDRAQVRYDPTVTPRERLVEAISEAGYRVPEPAA